MKNRTSVLKKWPWIGTLGILTEILSPGTTMALELDWSGQFSSEFNYIHNYSMDGANVGVDTKRANQGGYYIPGGGTNDASFQSVFLRLRPKVVVNDNIYLKSEIWFGDPIYGIFGNAMPYSTDQRQYYSSQSRGSLLTAQRFWGELITDIGTIQIGRVPLRWGLGVVWNSGDELWDRYMSTGDAIRWIAKFGSFSFIPSVIVNSVGNTVGGFCNVNNGPGCRTDIGSGGVVDYSIIFKYENPDEEFEAGVNLIKRLASSNQDSQYGLLVPSPDKRTNLADPVTQLSGTVNLLTYDFYAKKKFDRLVLKGEVPVVSGVVGSSQVSSLAFAGEANWKTSDVVEFNLKAGYAPGQSNSDSKNLNNYTAYYFNPNYHIGMIMFNYQLANLGGAQTSNNPNLAPNNLRSPYDNPIVNAAYMALSVPIKPSEKWTLRPALVYANALQTASAGATHFFNYWTRTTQANKAGVDQSSSLGFEADLGITFQWDDNFQFVWDQGLYFPGKFYAFSNVAGQENGTSPIYATSFRVGVNF